VGHGTPRATGAPTTDRDAQADEAASTDAWLNGYDAAFLTRDLDRLATFYHPDVTIFEGAGVNDGWTDYRDRHLGPELKAFGDLQFGHSNRRVHLLADGVAYVTSDYFLKATMKGRMIDSVGKETLVVLRQPDGTWRIRHSHTSGRARQ
jgi:ketosteroid isomerase-like protein